MGVAMLSVASAAKDSESGVTGGLLKSNIAAALTPVTSTSSACASASALSLALSTASCVRPALTSSSLSSDSVNDKLSTLFAPALTAASIQSDTFDRLELSTIIELVTVYPVSS